MKGRKLTQQVIWVIVITLLLAGCSTPAATTVSPTDTPTVIPLTPEPTSESLPKYDPNTILVTFTGDECTVSGPTELPTGNNTFVLKDLSGQYHELYVSILLDGHTYQDVLDLQSEPGEYVPKPRWVVHTLKIERAWNESNGEEVYTFRFYREGEHAIYIGSYSPLSIWHCGPLMVVESPSE